MAPSTTSPKVAKSGTSELKPGVLATELYRVLRDASLFASRDATLPMLNAVELEATGEYIIARGTDRFMLGISKAAYEGRKFKVLIPMEGVELIMRTLKPPRGRWKHRVAYLHITPQATLLRVSVEGVQMSVPLSPAEFPKTIQLFPKDGTKLLEVPAVLGYNPEYLGKFGKVTGARQATYYIQSPSKPMIVNVGPDFVGLIMPIRLPSDPPSNYARPDWLT